MANNVYSTIKFVTGDHEAEREFIRIFEFIETYEERSLEFSDFFRTNQEIVDQEFMETWVGPRKAEITKFMGTEVEVKSAWISPHVFLFNLIEHLRDFDPDIKISTAYSFGLDDQEFVLGFETDNPGAFLELVRDLRESKARPFTLRDTPIFTCLNKPIRECLEDLG